MPKRSGNNDRHDHLRSSYSLQRASTRWWTYFCWFAIDLALINSYLLYKHTHPKATHKKFQLKVADELIGGYTERKRIVRQNDCSPLQAESLNSHESVKMPGRPRVCRYCLKFKVKTPGGRTKESSHGCAQCNVSLHRDCFAAYHYDMQRKTPMVDESTQTGDILLTPSKTRSLTQSLQGNLGSGKARSSTQPVQGKLGSNKARSSTQPLQGKGSGKSKLLRTRPNNTSANKPRRQTQNQKDAGMKPPPKRRSPRKKTR